jgi:hypothetical protein
MGARRGKVLDLAGEALPTAVVGDLNSEADGSTTPTYGMMTAAGFTDAWLPRGAGETCCHTPDLMNHPSHFDQRIDFIPCGETSASGRAESKVRRRAG